VLRARALLQHLVRPKSSYAFAGGATPQEALGRGEGLEDCHERASPEPHARLRAMAGPGGGSQAPGEEAAAPQAEASTTEPSTASGPFSEALEGSAVGRARAARTVSEAHSRCHLVVPWPARAVCACPLGPPPAAATVHPVTGSTYCSASSRRSKRRLARAGSPRMRSPRSSASSRHPTSARRGRGVQRLARRRS